LSSSSSPLYKPITRFIPYFSLAVLACLSLSIQAQRPPLSQQASAALPDSPGAIFSPLGNPVNSEGMSSSSRDSVVTGGPEAEAASGGFGQSLGTHTAPIASPMDKYIEPGQQAPPLTAGDKVHLGLRDAVSPFAAIGWITSAAYSQALDSSPNYGQGWGPFAQRFGAAAARASTEGVLSDSVFAPVFHEDPRYYRLGPGHNFIHRTLYAVTRTIITKTDSGRPTPNFALVTGNAAGSILTNAYYPQANRDVKDTAETFAGSIGGSALGFFVSEFLSEALGVVHLKKTE